MDDLTVLTEKTIRAIIFDNYPVSFILIVLTSFGWWLHHVIARKQAAKLEDILTSLLNDITREILK